MQKPLFQHRHFNRLVLGLFATGFISAWGLPKDEINSVNASNGPQLKTAQTVLIVGDSLSAEYGLSRGTGWVQLMAKLAAKENVALQLINASISGDTSSGGLSRLPALLQQHQPQIVVIELGGNDALRGLSMHMTQQNLKSMALAGQKAGAQVLLVAMQVPPNYGDKYRQQMDAAYAEVAKTTGAQLNRQFLKGVADDAEPLKWFQADKIHPNEAAQSTMTHNIWPQIKKMLRKN